MGAKNTMTQNVPTYTVAYLLDPKNEIDLRRLCGEILILDPWNHHYSLNSEDSFICWKCGIVLSSCRSGLCLFSDSAVGPLEVIAQQLMKTVSQGFSRLDGTVGIAIRAVHDEKYRGTMGVHNFKDREAPWRWFALDSTPVERIVYCLLVLLPERITVDQTA